MQNLKQTALENTNKNTITSKVACKILQNTITAYGSVSKPWYLVNPKIAGKWMFIPLKMVSIGIDPYPYIWIF